MRLTIHLDTFDRVNPMAFAILWLDNETRQWSREGRAGKGVSNGGKNRRFRGLFFETK